MADIADIVIRVDSTALVSASTATQKLRQSTLSLLASLSRAGAANVAYRREVQMLRQAQTQGIITNTELARSLDSLRDRYRQMGLEIDRNGNLTERSQKQINNFGMISQQVGYQVGDFFVQVQSGTDALVALGQQGTQLAGLLPGLAGAIVGIGLSISTAFGASYLKANELTVSFKKMKEDFAGVFESLSPMFDFIPKAIDSVINAFQYLGSVIADNFDRAIAYATSFAIIMGVRVVAGFVLAGGAATAFFKLLKFGLISTGIGLLVVGLGEALLAFNKLTSGAGSFSAALVLMKNVAVEVFSRISQSFSAIAVYFQGLADNMSGIWLSLVELLQDRWSLFLDMMSVSASYFGADEIASKLEQSAIAFDKAANQAGSSAESYFKQSAAQTKYASDQLTEALTSPLVAWEELKKAFNKGSDTSVSIDPSSWLVPDTGDGKDKSGKESELEKLLIEQKQRATLLTLFGKEKALKEEIYSITKDLGDEASLLSAEQIKELAEINLLLTEQEALQEDLIQKYQGLADTLSSSMETAFMSMVEGTASVKDAFRTMAYDIVKELYRVLVVQQMVGSFNMQTGKGSGIVGSIGSFFTGGGRVAPSFLGGRASGGSMMGGNAYLVGEHGPELVVPRHSGTVMNANQTANALGGGSGAITVQNNITVTGSDAAMVRAEVAKMIPQITNATKAAVIDAKQRGGQMAAAFR